MELAAVLVVVLLAVFAIALVPYFIALRAMRPLLADLPRTDERITTGEQFQRIATSVSPKVLWLGGVGGVLMIVGNLMTVFDPLSEGRTVSTFPWQLFGVLVGAALTGYFVYLGILRRKSQARPN
jgi:amino acid transporter